MADEASSKIILCNFKWVNKVVVVVVVVDYMQFLTWSPFTPWKPRIPGIPPGPYKHGKILLTLKCYVFRLNWTLDTQSYCHY